MVILYMIPVILSFHIKNLHIRDYDIITHQGFLSHERRSLIHSLYICLLFTYLLGEWIRDDRLFWFIGERQKRRFAFKDIDLEFTWGKPPFLPSSLLSPKNGVILIPLQREKDLLLLLEN